jgi:hypothetical protein
MFSLLEKYSNGSEIDYNADSTKFNVKNERRYKTIYDFICTKKTFDVQSQLEGPYKCPVVIYGRDFLTWWKQETLFDVSSAKRKIPFHVRHDYLKSNMPDQLKISLAQDLYNLYCSGYSWGKSRDWIIPAYSVMKSINPKCSDDEIITMVNKVKIMEGADGCHTFAEKCEFVREQRLSKNK